MSLFSNLFSSPASQAGTAASGVASATQPDVTAGVNYANQAGQNTRGAIASLGPSPFFSAGQGLNMSPYAFQPGNTMNVGPGGQGAPQGAPPQMYGAPPGAANPNLFNAPPRNFFGGARRTA